MEERATPINLLPGPTGGPTFSTQRVNESKTKLLDESSIKINVKKKDECSTGSSKKWFKIELDMENGLLILLLFLSSYLKTSNLEFLPEGIKSNLFTFSIVKAFGLFAVFLIAKHYLMVCDV
jgi:hypothetical protein